MWWAAGLIALTWLPSIAVSWGDLGDSNSDTAEKVRSTTLERRARKPVPSGLTTVEAKPIYESQGNSGLAVLGFTVPLTFPQEGKTLNLLLKTGFDTISPYSTLMPPDQCPNSDKLPLHTEMFECTDIYVAKLGAVPVVSNILKGPITIGQGKTIQEITYYPVKSIAAAPSLLQRVSGVLGIGSNKQSSFPAQLKQAGVIPSAEMTVDLNTAGNAAVVYGGLDTSRISGRPAYFPLVNAQQGLWMIQSSSLNQPVAIDTGSDLFAIASAQATAYWAQYKTNARPGRPGSTQGTWTVKCDTKMKDFKLYLQDELNIKQKYTIPGKSLLGGSVGNGWCQGKLTSSGDSSFSTIGSLFSWNYVLHLDVAKQQLGVAKRK